MRTRTRSAVAASVAAAVMVIAQTVGGSVSRIERSTGGQPAQKPGSAAQQTGTATGMLTVGSSKFRLSRAYAFLDKVNADSAKQTYRILVTDRPLTAAIVKFAASAGLNEDDRLQFAVEVSDQKVSGIEAIVSGDQRVIRVNVYSPDSTMGLMLLEPTQFQVAALDADRIAGKLNTERPIADSRIRKTIEFDATFTAAISRPAAK